jgi:hypothetical protein
LIIGERLDVLVSLGGRIWPLIRWALLNGVTQRSYTDPFDTTSPAIPIGPHWMILWPFDAAGLSTVMRDVGTMVMFAGTQYAHLHICGSPWEGKEYHRGDRGVWTMKYERP